MISLQKKINKIFLLLTLFSIFSCSSETIVPNIILSPKILSIDQLNSRLFVADSSNNNLSLINLNDNSIVTGAPLLNQNSTVTLPQLPQDIVVANMGNGISRLFIIGTGPAPRNRITVLDYDSSASLKLASISPIIVGADTAEDQLDVLGGLALDTVNETLFVSNSTDSVVRVYHTSTGQEKTGSPLSVHFIPLGMSIDNQTHQLFVSSMGENSISIINTQDLSQAVTSLDVGIKSSDLAAATNKTGTILFLLNSQKNSIKVFNSNQTIPDLSTSPGNPITPPTPGSSIPADNLLSGSASQVAAASLLDGRIIGVVTQSTGDLGIITVSADLTSFSQTTVKVLSGQGAFGIDLLKDSSGNALKAYFAAPAGSAVSFVDLATNQYAGQIL